MPYTSQQSQIRQEINVGLSPRLTGTSTVLSVRQHAPDASDEAAQDDNGSALTAYRHSRAVLILAGIDTIVLWYTVIYLLWPLTGGTVQYVIVVAVSIVPVVAYVGAKFYRISLLALYRYRRGTKRQCSMQCPDIIPLVYTRPQTELIVSIRLQRAHQAT